MKAYHKPASVKVLASSDLNHLVNLLEDLMEEHAHIASMLKGLQISMKNTYSVAMILHPFPSEESIIESTLIKEQTLPPDRAIKKSNVNTSTGQQHNSPDLTGNCTSLKVLAHSLATFKTLDSESLTLTTTDNPTTADTLENASANFLSVFSHISKQL